MKRKQYSKESKAKAALEVLKGQKTGNEVAAEYGVHPSQINTWKKQQDRLYSLL
jgi:transposase-like protein